MAAEAGRKRQKCEVHGLHYDSAAQSGCMICLRRSSAPPPGTSRFAPSFGPEPGGSNSGWTVAFAVLRVLVTLVLLFGIGIMAMAGDPQGRASSALGNIAIVLVIGAIPLAFAAKLRNLRGVTYVFLIAAIIELLLQGKYYKPHRDPAATSVEPLVPFTSKDAQITVRLQSRARA